jgi:hypothetical protein
VVYEWSHNVDLPVGSEIDHLCHNIDLSCSGGKRCPHRRCIRVDHLGVKSTRENKEAADKPRRRGRFKDHCPKDHPYDEANTMWVTRTKNGKKINERQCKACNRARVYKAKQGVERPADAMESLSRAGCPSCRWGHVYDEQNTVYTSTTGKRRCRKCERFNDINGKRRKKGLILLKWYSIEAVGQWTHERDNPRTVQEWSEQPDFWKKCTLSKEELIERLRKAGWVDPGYEEVVDGRVEPGYLKAESVDGRIRLTNGTHRWAAAKKLGYPVVPVEVEPGTEGTYARFEP